MMSSGSLLYTAGVLLQQQQQQPVSSSCCKKLHTALAAPVLAKLLCSTRVGGGRLYCLGRAKGAGCLQLCNPCTGFLGGDFRGGLMHGAVRFSGLA